MKSQLKSNGSIVLVASCDSESERLLKDYEYDPDVIIEDSRLRGRKTGAFAIRLAHLVTGQSTPSKIITGRNKPVYRQNYTNMTTANCTAT